MHLAKPYTVIVLVLAMLCFETDGQTACSCYTFEKSSVTGVELWPVAKASCEDQNKHLVAMETEREWEFIKNEIQNRTTFWNDEWLIGLFRPSTNANWIWVSGQPLTIAKWQEGEPDSVDLYGLIAKNYPTGTYGLFGGITKNIYREWICEEETDNCSGTCMYYNLVATTATSISTRRTTTATTERTSSATQDHTGLSESTSSGSKTTPGKKEVTDKKESTSSGGETTPGKMEVTDKKGDRTTVIVLSVALAVVSLIALIAVAVVLFLKRKERRPQDAERPKKKSSNPLEDQSEPILNPENAAAHLGISETEDGIGSNGRESPQRATPSGNRECEYTMLNPLTMTPGESFYASLKEGEQGISTSGTGDETPTYVNQMPLSKYMNVPV